MVDSREKAQSIIMANRVWVDGQKVRKSGSRFKIDCEIILEDNPNQYVSRGGKKLEKALNFFNVNPKNKVAVDIGASTGGFTDCLLQHGAKKVYCIDVGYGQLDWKLRNDTRIVNIEKTNVRHLDTARFSFYFDLATIDVSFISITKVLPIVHHILKADGEIIGLLKPQFEAGRKNIKKGGIVDDPLIHKQVIMQLNQSVQDILKLVNLTFSPIKRSPGNIEYLAYFLNSPCEGMLFETEKIETVIKEAHQFFAG